MKNKRKHLLFLLTSMIVGSTLFLSCESSRVGPELPRPNPVVVPPQSLVLEGWVKDAANNNPIASSIVNISKTNGVVLITTGTDINGKYRYDVSSVTDATLLVSATIQNYGYQSKIAQIDKSNNIASVETILLNKIQGTVSTVTPVAGGNISNTTNESLSGAPLTISVPANAVSQNVQITAGSLPVNQVPPISSSQVPIAVGVFEPSGIQFSQPVTITFPLPVRKTAGTVYPLLIYNSASGQWVSSGFNGTVSSTGLLMTAQVTHFSSYTAAETAPVYTPDPPTSVESITSNTETVQLKMGGQQTNPYNVTSSITISGSTGEVDEHWLQNTFLSKFSYSVGTVTQNLVLTVPSLPSQYSVNGVIQGPAGHETESGDWVYRWTVSKYNSTKTTTATGGVAPNSWSRSISFVSEEWKIVNKGWYWIPHNQGGIQYGPY